MSTSFDPDIEAIMRRQGLVDFAIVALGVVLIGCAVYLHRKFGQVPLAKPVPGAHTSKTE